MMTFDDVVTRIHILQAGDLSVWIEERWVMPAQEGQTYHFSETDIARVQLICDMYYDLNIEAETMPILLSLLDQVYDLRHQLRLLAGAVAAQPEDIRGHIATVLEEKSRFT